MENNISVPLDEQKLKALLNTYGIQLYGVRDGVGSAKIVVISPIRDAGTAWRMSRDVANRFPDWEMEGYASIYNATGGLDRMEVFIRPIFDTKGGSIQ